MSVGLFQPGIENPELGIIPSCDTLCVMVLITHTIRQIGRSLIAAGRMMLKPEVPRDAAGISYFSLVAMIPAMLVLLALADRFLGWMHLHNTVVQNIVNLFPGSRQFLMDSLREIAAPSTTVVVSCMLVVFWSFSWIFTFMERAINRAWGISNQRAFWESRLRSIALMILGGFSLLISAAITAFASAVSKLAEAHPMVSAEATSLVIWFWHLLFIAVGLLIAVFVFALLYKWTPHCKISWKEAISAALVTTFLWEIGSFIFVKLVQVFDYPQIYGKMGAVIALLTWIYTSNMIVIFGANFSAHLDWMISKTPHPVSSRMP